MQDVGFFFNWKALRQRKKKEFLKTFKYFKRKF